MAPVTAAISDMFSSKANVSLSAISAKTGMELVALVRVATTDGLSQTELVQSAEEKTLHHNQTADSDTLKSMANARKSAINVKHGTELPATVQAAMKDGHWKMEHVQFNSVDQQLVIAHSKMLKSMDNANQ